MFTRMIISSGRGKREVVPEDSIFPFINFQAVKSILHNLLNFKDIMVKKLTLWEALDELFLQFFSKEITFHYYKIIRNLHPRYQCH